MPVPTGWPPSPPSGIARSIRFYLPGLVATANFNANAYLFFDSDALTSLPLPYVRPGSITPVHLGGVSYSPPDVYGPGFGGGGQLAQDVAPPEHANSPYTQQASPKPMLFARAIFIRNRGVGALEFSFDGVVVHGVVPDGETLEMRDRYESGIAVRGAGVATPTFELEAW